jgi:hypothetical protein
MFYKWCENQANLISLILQLRVQDHPEDYVNRMSFRFVEIQLKHQNCSLKEAVDDKTLS